MAKAFPQSLRAGIMHCCLAMSQLLKVKSEATCLSLAMGGASRLAAQNKELLESLFRSRLDPFVEILTVARKK